MHHIKPKIFKPDGKQRCGRGFSRDELGKAGVTYIEAVRVGLPVDFRRKTAHDENIEAVKAYMKKAKTEAKPKPKPEPKTETKKKP
ncbi:MAG: ribosomal protein L13e [Candidatus Bathyarchaeota archaeon]|nr:ribosomal protein L13e [Candidatus Bathyarchaeota archaeon]